MHSRLAGVDNLPGYAGALRAQLQRGGKTHSDYRK
jgi:hypothetical protein